ncbi:hypothetical protein [Saccharothrix syringae]|uniref:HEAT repeat domain-containing protein n=1 Tax=Saccharothrix syringae TaxID=103733 RepID=A0A5Q0H1J0_SACSY|nr:hypothetical protein [Saccharothrix syringae]QFZ19775.1 hypothetical protein EKG83_22160 [Saccharothrix syringae]
MITLEDPDWSRLHHAYGPAEDTPGLLARLRGEDWEEAFGELFGSLVHQGGAYPATVAAVPFLVDLALDRAAPGRGGALWLLGACAQAIADRLPEGGRAALADVARRLLPLAADPDAEVRAAVYEIATHLVDATEVVPVLRARFEQEDDEQAAVALTRPLSRHGALDPAAVAARGNDAVLFAAAWCGVVDGRDLPGAVDHLVRLWPDHAGRYEGGASPALLVEAAGAAARPVLRRLREARAAAVDDLVDGWVALAGVSRAAADPALTGLLDLVGDARATTSAVRLVGALARVRPGAPERSPEVCDAVAGFAGGPVATGLPASAAVALFAARDRRWAAAARAVVAGCPREPVVADGAGGRRPFSAALLAARPVAWAADDLIDLAVAAIAAWPPAVAGWVAVLAELPPSEEVVRTLPAALPHAPERVCRLLARIAADHPAVLAAGWPVETPRVPDDDAAAWVATATALLGVGDGAFERVWRLADGDADLLAAWARHPSPAFHDTCLELLDGTARVSSPDRHCQLVAARLVAGAGDVARAWPTVRAVADAAGDPLTDAVALGHRLAASDADRRREWVELLGDIARNGRDSWAGPDPWAGAVAVQALQELGGIAPEEAVDLAVAGLRAAIAVGRVCHLAPVAGRVLRTALVARPDLRDRVAEVVAPLVGADTRFDDDIARDVDAVGALRAVLDGG